MMLDLVLLVLFGAVVVLFSEEILNALKRFLSFPLGTLIVPMLLASALLLAYPQHVVFVLMWLAEKMYDFSSFIASFLPFGSRSFSIALIAFWLLIPFSITFLLKKWVQKRRYRTFSRFDLVKMILWLFLVFIWVANI